MEKIYQSKYALRTLLSSVILSSLAVAAPENIKKDNEIVTHTEFGYIETQGNTRTQTFNLESKIKKGWDKNVLHLLFDGHYASDKSDEIKNAYFIELEYDYKFAENLAFSYLIGYKKDKFSGYDYQFYTGPGIKYKAIKTDKQNLSIEASLLYSSDDIQDTDYDSAGNIIEYPNPDDKTTFRTVSGYTDEYAATRAKLVYQWQISTNLKFNQELSYRANLKDTDVYFIFSKTALSTKISDIFSAGINYKVNYSNNPSTGKDYTDRTFTANLIIDY